MEGFIFVEKRWCDTALSAGPPGGILPGGIMFFLGPFPKGEGRGETVWGRLATAKLVFVAQVFPTQAQAYSPVQRQQLDTAILKTKHAPKSLQHFSNWEKSLQKMSILKLGSSWNGKCPGCIKADFCSRCHPTAVFLSSDALLHSM